MAQIGPNFDACFITILRVEPTQPMLTKSIWVCNTEFTVNKLAYKTDFRWTLQYMITLSRLFSLRKPSIIHSAVLPNKFPIENHKDIAIEFSKCQGNGNHCAIT